MITVSNALDASPAPMTVEDALPSALPRYQPGLDLRRGSTGGGPLLDVVRRDAGAVLERLLAHVRNGTTDQAAALMYEPVDHYLDENRWHREIEKVHKQVPMPLALSCELPAAGTFKAVDVADVPVLITRGRDGQVHAMINACRHRGSPVASAGTGRANRLTCPYHAWSYDLEGCLTGVYGEKSFGDIDRGSRGLLRLWCEERAGIVFVGLTPGATHDLDDWLGELQPLLAGLGLADLHHFSTRELPGTNYKVILDGFLETYHFAALHATSVALTNISNLVAFDSWGPHQRNASALRTISEQAVKPPAEQDPAMGVAPNYWLFPGMAIAGAYRHLTAVSIVLPGRSHNVSNTQQILAVRRPPIDDEEQHAAARMRDWFYDVTLNEDYAAQAAVAASLPALAGTDLLFGRNEPGVQHFHRTLARYVG
jgi:phenylpropionate dioxygenase-like ring-hydroxylating dioxygenase large terminal subunit